MTLCNPDRPARFQSLCRDATAIAGTPRSGSERMIQGLERGAPMGEKSTAADDDERKAGQTTPYATSEAPIPGGMQERAVAAGGGADPTSAEATTVKSSKSNSSE